MGRAACPIQGRWRVVAILALLPGLIATTPLPARAAGLFTGVCNVTGQISFTSTVTVVPAANGYALTMGGTCLGVPTATALDPSSKVTGTMIAASCDLLLPSPPSSGQLKWIGPPGTVSVIAVGVGVAVVSVWGFAKVARLAAVAVLVWADQTEILACHTPMVGTTTMTVTGWLVYQDPQT